MPLQIEIIDCDTYLHIIHRGNIDDMDVALKNFRTSLQEAHRLEKSGILADLTEIEYSPLSAIDRILYFQSAAESYKEIGGQDAGKMRVAILQPPEAESHYTPGLDTARENGMEVQLFYAERQALSWLES